MALLAGPPFRPPRDAPLYQALVAHLQAAILGGQLAGGTRLPSTRALAGELRLSRNTVLTAYAQLTAEGYLEGVAGSGTYVARVLPERRPASPRRPGRAQPPPAVRAPTLAVHAQRQLAAPHMSEPPPSPPSRQPPPFRFGSPDLQAFPHQLWSRLVVRQARRLSASRLAYQDPAGLRALREAVAAHATVARRVHCTPDQIVIVSGSQGALDLAARLLLNPGDPVWVEDPGYLGARGAFLGVGARLVPVPVDAEGLVVAAGEARAPTARLAYVTPSHQFPLGVTMSLPRRLALLAWAGRAGAYLLEDDYDSEYRFEGRPLASLQGLAAPASDRVIYVGTFSKVLFPALRLGYLILPPALVEPCLKVRAFVDTHTPVLEQAVLADFIAAGHFARHLRRMRALYAERHAALLAALRPLPLAIHSPQAGIHVVAWLPAGLDAARLVARAAEQGLVLSAVSRFCLEPHPRHGLILGFAEFTPKALQEAARRLAPLLAEA